MTGKVARSPRNVFVNLKNICRHIHFEFRVFLISKLNFFRFLDSYQQSEKNFKVRQNVIQFLERAKSPKKLLF